MQLYVERFIPQDEQDLFLEISEVIANLPNIDLGEGKHGEECFVSCHMLARAIAEFFPVEAKDGHFNVAWQHSWLVTQSGNIIDVYPVGCLSAPLLLHAGDISTPWKNLYKEEKIGAINRKEFPGHVERVSLAMADTIERLQIKEPEESEV